MFSVLLQKFLWAPDYLESVSPESAVTGSAIPSWVFRKPVLINQLAIQMTKVSQVPGKRYA